MSSFTQNYNQYLNEDDRTDDGILLSQRAGRPTWVLTTERRVRGTQTSTDHLSAVLVAIENGSALAEWFPHALVSTLPWVSLLLEGDRKVFAEEAADVLSACESISRNTAFAREFEFSQVTAEA